MVLGRVSIPFLAAIAVVKEVESIIRVVLAAALTRAARGALSGRLVEIGEGAIDRSTSVTNRAIRAFLTASWTSYGREQNQVSKR